MALGRRLLRSGALLSLLLQLGALHACLRFEREEQGSQCQNGHDDDGDDLADCDDPSCKLLPECGLCGNGVLDDGEICDDGNTFDLDGCSAHCLSERCGNGQVEPGEECDDGNTIPADGCSITCVPDECGDRILDLSLELCEDGNRLDGDGCSKACDVEEDAFPLCGNFQFDVDPQTGVFESCDDGNRRSGDFCSATCQSEFCGDGIVQPSIGERCDDADPNRPPECRNCRVPTCGDFFVDVPSEQCDDGNRTSGDGCSSTCQQEFCGDGVVQPLLGEDCDDANGISGDGCDFCRVP